MHGRSRVVSLRRAADDGARRRGGEGKGVEGKAAAAAVGAAGGQLSACGGRRRFPAAAAAGQLRHWHSPYRANRSRQRPAAAAAARAAVDSSARAGSAPCLREARTGRVAARCGECGVARGRPRWVRRGAWRSETPRERLSGRNAVV
eukprot:350564-Chlamydomonas_euryale.AAC.2